MHDGGGGSGGPEIKVDINGLEDLAGQVRSENDKTLRGRAAAVERDFTGGVPFGARFPGGGVFVAKTKYKTNMEQAIATLNAYVMAADVLADAAEKVAKNYRSTDALSAARANDVNKELNAALERAKAEILESDARRRHGNGQEAV